MSKAVRIAIDPPLSVEAYVGRNISGTPFFSLFIDLKEVSFYRVLEFFESNQYPIDLNEMNATLLSGVKASRKAGSKRVEDFVGRAYNNRSLEPFEELQSRDRFFTDGGKYLTLVGSKKEKFEGMGLVLIDANLLSEEGRPTGEHVRRLVYQDSQIYQPRFNQVLGLSPLKDDEAAKIRLEDAVRCAITIR